MSMLNFGELVEIWKGRPQKMDPKTLVETALHTGDFSKLAKVDLAPDVMEKIKTAAPEIAKLQGALKGKNLAELKAKMNEWHIKACGLPSPGDVKLRHLQKLESCCVADIEHEHAGVLAQAAIEVAAHSEIRKAYRIASDEYSHYVHTANLIEQKISDAVRVLSNAQA